MSDRTLYHREYYRENKATTTKIRKPPTPPPDPVPDPETMWAVSRSRENLVFFFRVELIEARDHKIRPRVPENVYRQLRKSGLISKSKHGWATEYTLSPLVLTILSEFEEVKII